MSNIVKYPFVNMQGKEARTVSYEQPGDFTPLTQPKKAVIRDAKEVEEEKKRGLSIEDIFGVEKKHPIGGDDEEEPTFSEGIPVTDLTEEFEEAKEAAKAEAEEIVEAARAQADEIIIDARQQADQVRSQAYDEGFESGKEAGIAAGEQALDDLRAEIEAERAKNQAEFDEMLAGLEPKFVGVVCNLMEKLTGVVIDSEEDLILHLIRAGLKDVRKHAERVIIRVCPDDSLIAESHKNELMAELDEDVTVEIQPQESMEKNECIIETDNQMLDAGIRVQLKNLLTALRLMV